MPQDVFFQSVSDVTGNDVCIANVMDSVDKFKGIFFFCALVWKKLSCLIIFFV